MKDLKKTKIAIVCDWLTVQGGAEKVILGIHQLFPNAPIYTSLYNPQKIKGFENARIITSFLQKIPSANKHHQYFLPLLPRVFESFDLSHYDIVISSSHSCAKGIIVPPHTLHICYCHSPMRYAWDNYQKYIREYAISGILKKLATPFIHKIRIWDRISADRVDHFIANSNYIKQRIAKFYRKDSAVIHPFIDPEQFINLPEKKNFYLAVGRLTSYKKFDLIVEAFNQNGLPLKIVGTGNMQKSLMSKAKSNIEFLGFTPDQKLRELYGTAKALIFPQIEDFGIIPLEAMASGCPVIAFGRGGGLETVLDGETGVFFYEQSSESLNHAVEHFQKINFDRQSIMNHANKFGRSHFVQQFTEFIQQAWQNHQITLSK